MLEQFFFFYFHTVTWVDYLILCIIIFYMLEGYVSGGIQTCFDLLKFVIAFLAGLEFYTLLSNGVKLFSSIPLGIIRAVSFFIIVVVVELILHMIIQQGIFHFIREPKH